MRGGACPVPASRGQVLLWAGVPGSETASRLLAWDGVDWTRVDG